MATITPVWTDNVSVISAQMLSRGSIVSATIDLRSKFGAYFYARVGRTGGTPQTNGVQVKVRRTINNNGIGHPVSLVATDVVRVAATSTVVATTSNSGQKVLTVADTTGFQVGNRIAIFDTGLTRLEFAVVSKLTSTTLTLDRNLQYTHTSGDADNVTNRSEIYTPVYLQGGATFEIVFDYSDDTSGDSVIVQCLAQTYDSNSSV